MSEDNRTIAEILGPVGTARLMQQGRSLDDILHAVDQYAVAEGVSPVVAFEKLIPVARQFLLAMEADRATGH